MHSLKIVRLWAYIRRNTVCWIFWGFFWFIIHPDPLQLEVFVDLAMNATEDETAMEIDRVSMFHRAASGYAPFIFGLGEHVGYTELSDIAQEVWMSLQTDQALPKLLVRKNYLFVISKN